MYKKSYACCEHNCHSLMKECPPCTFGLISSIGSKFNLMSAHPLASLRVTFARLKEHTYGWTARLDTGLPLSKYLASICTLESCN